MRAKVTTLGEYIGQLERGKEERPEQVRAGLEIYIELWKKAIEKKIVSPSDDVETALEEVERSGGLYKVAEE